NVGKIENYDVGMELANPTCGDVIGIHVKLDDEGKVCDAKFHGYGCSISQSSASMLTVKLRGKTIQEAKQLIDDFYGMMKGAEGDHSKLGELQALQGVSKYPVRIKCATLAWKALEQGLEQMSNKEGTQYGD
ncbi:MAG: nitrogen fixation protein, partial [Bacilli bacterium]|nr:nitrogen fixation protein [Bacilli bacterium]